MKVIYFILLVFSICPSLAQNKSTYNFLFDKHINLRDPAIKSKIALYLSDNDDSIPVTFFNTIELEKDILIENIYR